MANDYFDTADFTAMTRNTRALAEAVMAALAAVEAGFDLLPGNLVLRQNKQTFVASDTGAVNAHIVSLTQAPPAYSDGLHIAFRAATTNTAAATINVNSLGVKDIRNYAGTALSGGEIVANAFTVIRYDNTNGYFRIISPLTTVSSVTTFNIDSMTAETSPADADTAPLYDASAAAQRKMTLQNLLVVGWGVAAAVDAAADYVLIYDASANALKKTLVNTIADEGSGIFAARVFGQRGS